ncbi:hypothetical protein GCM10007382_14340 [Salinibacterium xinjiangense]|uniref:hypothetical protein n=1 Tax=Salinibacterium xinjiangense TaxID=386302 RepID=UPI000BE33F95|nr:hypothetical protein [Salinibacterium xinjiangense]GGK95264.1 hypothetical protein GCM10007382_14340 [Salinibacterium xinjiangense]
MAAELCVAPLSYNQSMIEADASAAVLRIGGVEGVVYVPPGATGIPGDVVRRMESIGRVFWQRVAWLHPWDVIVELGSGFGELIATVPLPPGSRLVSAENGGAEFPFLQRTLSEAGRAVELIESEVSLMPPLLVGLAVTATLASNPGQSQNACFRIGWHLDSYCAIAELTPLLTRFVRWAVIIPLAGLSAGRITELARGRFLFLIDRRTHNLIRVGSGRSEAAVSRMLESGWIYPDEAVLLSSAELAGTW